MIFFFFFNYDNRAELQLEECFKALLLLVLFVRLAIIYFLSYVDGQAYLNSLTAESDVIERKKKKLQLTHF